MATASTFEDLDVWKLAFKLVREVYALTQQGAFSRDFSLKDQVRRAAVSSMTNIAEGFGRQSTTEFVRFLDIARSSAAEVQSLLYVAESQAYLTHEHLAEIYSDLQDFRFRVGALMRYLRQYKATT